MKGYNNGRNSAKTHHVKADASIKDSAPLSFFRLDKNYRPREHDTFIKILQDSQPRQSIDHICIEPINNSVTSFPIGKFVQGCCLYCSKVYKLEAGLKPHINRCKERDKNIAKPELSVINHPPAENDTVNITREYTWSQNGKIISASNTGFICNKIFCWHKNLLLSPAGACSKRYIEEIAKLLNERVSDSLTFKRFNSKPS